MADDDSHLVPADPSGYRVEFADEYKHMTVDKNSPLWKEAIEDAHQAKLSHAAFKVMVNRHAKRVMDAHEAKSRTPAVAQAAPAPAKPAAPAKKYSEMSMSEQLAYGASLGRGHGV
jgi:hypothetical protein